MDEKLAAHSVGWELGDEAEIEKMFNNQQMYLNNPTTSTSKAYMADMFHYIKHMHQRVAPAVQSELQETCELGALFELSHEAGGYQQPEHNNTTKNDNINNEEASEDAVLSQFSSVVASSELGAEVPRTTMDAAGTQDVDGDGDGAQDERDQRSEDGEDKRAKGRHNYDGDSEDQEDAADSKARELRRVQHHH